MFLSEGCKIYQMSFGPKMKAGFSFKSELPTFCYITNMIIDDVISYKEYAIDKRSVLFHRVPTLVT